MGAWAGADAADRDRRGWRHVSSVRASLDVARTLLRRVCFWRAGGRPSSTVPSVALPSRGKTSDVVVSNEP
jgi:hypothetical protein